MHFDRARGWSKKPFRLQSGSGLSFHKLDIWYSKQLLAAAVWLKNSTLCVTEILYERFVLFCLGWTPRNNKKNLFIPFQASAYYSRMLDVGVFFNLAITSFFTVSGVHFPCSARHGPSPGQDSAAAVTFLCGTSRECLRRSCDPIFCSQGLGRRVKVAFTLSWCGVG